MTVFRDLKTMRLREPGQLLVACLVDDVLVFLVPNIADALQEKQREYIGFEVSCIDRPPQDIRRLPKVALKLAQCNFTCAQCSVPNLPVQMANLCRVSLLNKRGFAGRRCARIVFPRSVPPPRLSVLRWETKRISGYLNRRPSRGFGHARSRARAARRGARAAPRSAAWQVDPPLDYRQDRRLGSCGSGRFPSRWRPA